jgi:hypothetical protein
LRISGGCHFGGCACLTTSANTPVVLAPIIDPASLLSAFFLGAKNTPNMRIHPLSQAAFSKILWPRTRIRLALAKLSCHPQPVDHTAGTGTRARPHGAKAKGEAFIMKRRKFISAVPAAILLAQRPSAAIAQTRKKGVMLANRIGPSSSEPCVATADGQKKRMLTDSLREDAMPLYTLAKVY